MNCSKRFRSTPRPRSNCQHRGPGAPYRDSRRRAAQPAGNHGGLRRGLPRHLELHALEETEHKAVAFDVYRVAMGGDDKVSAYALRSLYEVISNTPTICTETDTANAIISMNSS